MAQVSGIEVKFSADTANLERGISKAQGAISGFAKGAAAALAGALSAGVFVDAGRAAINFADDIGKMAQKVGMSTEALSKLTYAAKLADVSMQELQVGVQQLSKNMESGSEGLAALGISATDSAGNLRSTAEVFADVAEAFAGMEDGAGKTAIAMNIFGRSGAQLIPLLNSGRLGLNEMGSEARKFGVVISQDAAQAAEKFNDNLTRLNTISEGLAQSLAQELLNPLNDVLQSLLDYVANGDMITNVVAGIKAEFADLGRVVGFVSSKTSEMSGFFSAIDGFARKYGPMSGAAQNGFFGMFPGNANMDPTGSLASVENFNPQSVNREGKGDLPLLKPPSLGGGAGKDGSQDVSTSPSQEPGRAFTDRLAMIKEQFATERELLVQEYALNQQTLDASLANKLISEQQYYDLSQQLAEDHAAALNAIQSARISEDLSNITNGLGSMAAAFQGGGKKMLKVSKAIAAAQAIVATIQAAVDAMKNPLLIDPASKFAAYAAVFAKGMSAVAAIKGVSESGGSSGGGGGGGGGRGGGMAAGGGAAAPSPTTTFSFTLMNDPMGFGEKFARQFIDQLNSTQRNGGTIRGVIA